MAIVRFPEYRQYEAARVEASNAMMALLAGAQLANHLLKLTEGSAQLLPDVYPNVPHIRRFHLTTEAATNILAAADTHLGAMSVPYALAIHENYMRTCLALLERAGTIAAGVSENTVSASQHSIFSRATGGRFDRDSLEQLHVLRLMRNCLIHNGQKATSTLVNRVSRWSPALDAAWSRLTHRSPRGLRIGDDVTFSHGEMTLALAVTKNLDRQANSQLQTAVTRSVWADIVLDDVLATDPSVLRRSDRERKLAGVARHYYRSIGLTDQELGDAIARH